MNDKLHVVIFCIAEYKELVQYCVESIFKFVKDDIASINVVSNLKFDINDVNFIPDRVFWEKLDPQWEFRDLYNENWIKQQIFKLNVDKFFEGNVLIVDAEVIFLKNMSWLENGKIKYYTSFSPYYEPYFKLNKEILNLEKKIKYSFITDAMVFSTEVLEHLHRDIMSYYGMPLLAALDKLIIRNTGFNLSEFELYGHYIMDKFPDVIEIDNNPVDHLVVLNNRQAYTLDELTNIINKLYPYNRYISVNIKVGRSHTAWLSFYEQVKDPSWPDCDTEEEFIKLPEHIQNECITQFGYRPKSKTSE